MNLSLVLPQDVCGHVVESRPARVRRVACHEPRLGACRAVRAPGFGAVVLALRRVRSRAIVIEPGLGPARRLIPGVGRRPVDLHVSRPHKLLALVRAPVFVAIWEADAARPQVLQVGDGGEVYQWQI